MKNILITGGSGYIGTHTIVELLKNADYNVVIIDNFSNSNAIILNRVYDITKTPIKIYARDCKEIIDDILIENEIDGIIHFAAYKSVEESILNPIQYYDNNINSLLNILDSSKFFGIKNIIFSSSCALYGNIKNLPVNEDSPISNPESPYAYTKLACERILSDFSKINPDMNIISLRYFNPVGAHESGLIGESPINKPNNIMPVICDSVENSMMVFGSDYPTRDGTCVRDYIHVSDIANAHVLALNYIFNSNNIGYDIFNIGSGSGYTVLEIIKAFESVNNIKVNWKFGNRRIGDIVEIYSDSSKAKRILGWEPKRNLNDIVLSAWNWHKNRI